jgi:hypothetical protein
LPAKPDQRKIKAKAAGMRQAAGFIKYLRKVIAERGNFSRTGETDVMKTVIQEVRRLYRDLSPGDVENPGLTRERSD